MKKYFQYLSYVIRHKWFVFLACVKRRQILIGIMHDLSKFLPSEWFGYMNHFYGPQSKRGIKEGRDSSGYYKPVDSGDLNFDKAWLHHTRWNKHHYQYWALVDEDNIYLIPMPEKYMIEMICDWEGAARAQHCGNKENDYLIKEWYKKNKNKMKLHPESREKIEKIVGLLK